MEADPTGGVRIVTLRKMPGRTDGDKVAALIFVALLDLAPDVRPLRLMERAKNAATPIIVTFDIKERK